METTQNIPQPELDAVLARHVPEPGQTTTTSIRRAVEARTREACEGHMGQDELNALLAEAAEGTAPKDRHAPSAAERAILRRAESAILYARDAYHVRDGMRAELARHPDERVRVALMSRKGG